MQKVERHDMTTRRRHDDIYFSKNQKQQKHETAKIEYAASFSLSIPPHINIARRSDGAFGLRPVESYVQPTHGDGALIPFGVGYEGTVVHARGSAWPVPWRS